MRTTRLRRSATCTAALLALLTGCSGGEKSTGTVTGTPSTPSLPTLGTAAISPAGGTLTVSKAGDPLDGMSITVPGGSFPDAVTISVASLPSTPVLQTDGIVALSPRVVISASSDSGASGMIAVRIPVKIADGITPIVAIWDSVANELRGLPTFAIDSTAVVTYVRRLTMPRTPTAIAAQVRTDLAPHVSLRPSAQTAAAKDPIVMVTMGIPASVLMRDYDTGFQPGTDDWQFKVARTEAVDPARNQSLQVLPVSGALVSELYYFNAGGARVRPLRQSYPRDLPTAEYSARGGLRLAAGVELMALTGLDMYYAATERVVTDWLLRPQRPGGTIEARFDKAIFEQIRAMFALSSMSGKRPPAILVNVGTRNQGATPRFWMLGAYKAVGRKIFVADPVFPNDGTRALEFPENAAMVPYTAGGTAYAGAYPDLLENAITVDGIANAMELVRLTINRDVIFSPPSRFASWNGTLFDTTYVVDTLRLWVECAKCLHSFTSTLSPRPTKNLGAMVEIYTMANGVPTLVPGIIGGNGAIFNSSSVPLGGSVVRKFLFSSAPSANSPAAGAPLTWLDWRTLLIRRLDVTMTPGTSTVALNTNVTFALSAPATEMPDSVNYRWNFNDGTAVQNTGRTASVTKAFTRNGTFEVVGEIIDPRNNQVIGRQRTTITAGTPPAYSVWKLVAGAGTVTGNVPDPDPTYSYVQIARNAQAQLAAYWSAPSSGQNFRAFWYVPTTQDINGDRVVAGLYLSDVLPGAVDPPLGLVAAAVPPNTVSPYDDPAIRPQWTATGTPPANVTLTATNPYTNTPFPYAPHPCLSLPQSQAPFVYHTVTMNMNGTTATGSITYFFRGLRPSCATPREVLSTWSYTVPFTATRVR